MTVTSVEPVVYGPTFTKDENGEYILPESSIGPYVIHWIHNNLVFPDGERAGEPMRLTPEQMRFICWAYALDENDRFLYNNITMVRIKGASKSGLAAMLSVVEWIGPCRPARNEHGQLIAVPHPRPWVQVAAVNLSQTVNTMGYLTGLCNDELREKYGLEIGKEMAYSASGGKIQAVTSSPRSLEGARPSFVVMEETHQWVPGSTTGHEMFEVISRNLAKAPDGSSRMLQISNQFDPSENSVLQRTWEAYQAIQSGRSRAKGFMWDSIEAPPDLDFSDPEQVKLGVLAARGDAFWLDVDRVVEEVMDPRIPPSISRRFWWNQVVASEDSFISPQEWGSLAVEGEKIEPGDSITLGLDASVSDDHTVLVACRADGLLQILWRWAPNPRNPEDKLPRQELDDAVRHAFEYYDVKAFFADPSYIESHVLQWNIDFGRQLAVRAASRDPIGFDLRGRKQDMTKATELFYDAVISGQIKHPNDPVLNWYVVNGRRVPNRYGYAVAKVSPDSDRKIDGLISAILAYNAHAQMNVNGKQKKRPVKRGAIRLRR